MNAIDFLNAQHDQVDKLFAKIEKSRSDDAKEKLFAELGDALAIHATIEEKIFYPAVKAKRTEDILLESLEEHLAIKRILADLVEMEPSDEHFEAKLTVLKEEVQHHVGEEKSELFPKVKKLLSAAELNDLGDQLSAMSEDLEETDARFNVPNETEQAAPLP